MKLSVTTYPMSQFSYNKKEKYFVSECSTLNNNIFDKHYNDACDCGFAIKSPKTSREVRFFFLRENRTADNEVVSYEFVSEDVNDTRYTATIFND